MKLKRDPFDAVCRQRFGTKVRSVHPELLLVQNFVTGVVRGLDHSDSRTRTKRIFAFDRHPGFGDGQAGLETGVDRKSTRLNSSHFPSTSRFRSLEWFAVSTILIREPVRSGYSRSIVTPVSGTVRPASKPGLNRSSET